MIASDVCSVISLNRLPNGAPPIPISETCRSTRPNFRLSIEPTLTSQPSCPPAGLLPVRFANGQCRAFLSALSCAREPPDCHRATCPTTDPGPSRCNCTRGTGGEGSGGRDPY